MLYFIFPSIHQVGVSSIHRCFISHTDQRKFVPSARENEEAIDGWAWKMLSWSQGRVPTYGRYIKMFVIGLKLTLKTLHPTDVVISLASNCDSTTKPKLHPTDISISLDSLHPTITNIKLHHRTKIYSNAGSISKIAQSSLRILLAVRMGKADFH